MGWLILAAGQSSRFDGDKLLSCIPHTNKTLLEHCLEKYVDHGAPVLVVTRPNHIKLHKLLTGLGVTFTLCPTSHLGMGASLAWGVKQIEQQWSWVGIALADMGLVKSETLCRLKEQVTQNTIVLPKLTQHETNTGKSLSYRGHPVLFGKNFFKGLLNLKADQGARHILQQQKQHIIEISTEDCGAMLDIDSRLDLKDLAPLFSSNTLLK